MNTPTVKPAPFHSGELRAQQLAGGGPPGFAIRDAMPDQHRNFFGLLRYALLATTDEEGWPVATIVTGSQGFMSSPDPQSLRIDTTAGWQNNMLPLLQPGKAVGMLGIDLSTRRRNRVNGMIERIDADGVHLSVMQSFGNCPKYIQLRHVDNAAVEDVHDDAAGFVNFQGLDRDVHDIIRQADTFFVATSSGAHAEVESGIDISHKGGRPGFIRIDGDTLTIPDFIGNRYFNTLGNLLLDRRAALLFVDFSNGNLLHLQGTVEIAWNSEEVRQVAGAERLWRFHVERGWHAKGAVALRWMLQEFSPATENTGIWSEATGD
jgi:predicted pyridoxine 5'-phosphate oxidase superfamily flavin-nucleotide-binding protein